MIRKLNLGCGPIQPKGWDNADADPSWKAADPALLSPAAYDIIVANHVLQMVPHHEVVKTLEQWSWLLADGGTLRVLVPDLMAAVHEFENGAVHHLKVSDETEPTLDGKLCAYLSQAGTTRSFYTPLRLLDVLRQAGFSGVSRCEPHETTCAHPEILELDSRLDESLIAEAWL